MTELYHKEDEPQYITLDRKNYTNVEEQLEQLKKSHTIYVGNVSFFTKELQIYETFSRVGPIKRLVMGLNSQTKTPCGFCFVEYYNQEHAFNAIKYISDSVCDERVIRCDADPGFLPGRQFGRGQSGGQIRDEWRTDYDPGRGRFVLPEAVSHSRKRGRDDRDDDDYDGYNRGGRRIGRQVSYGSTSSGRERRFERASTKRDRDHRQSGRTVTESLNAGLGTSR